MNRNCKRGEVTMMPELVMKIGNDFLKKEEKNKKEEQISFIYGVRVFFAFLETKRQLKKLDYRNIIEKNKDIMNGKAVIKGTRVSAKAIYEQFVIKCEKNNFNAKDFAKEIKNEYPSLKNKSESTIIKGMLYYVAHKSIFNFFK